MVIRLARNKSLMVRPVSRLRGFVPAAPQRRADVCNKAAFA